MVYRNKPQSQEIYCLSGGKDCAREQERARLYEELQASHVELIDKAQALEESKQQLQQAMSRQEQVNTALREIDRMKTNFIGIASHELTTPLTFLLGALEFLEESLPGRISEDEQSLLDYAMQGSKRLADIVENLLYIAKLDADSFHLERESASLFPILTHIRDSFSGVLEARNLTLNLGSGDLWPTLSVDPSMIRKALVDLIGNAVKYTEDGGEISLTGAVRTLESLAADADQIRLFCPDFPENLGWDGDYFEVCVADTGIGISRQQLPHIFERFYTAGRLDEHSSGDKFLGKGAGLGLALVRRIVEGHEGLCWAKSPGSCEETGVARPGCSIHLLLPWRQDSEPAEILSGEVRRFRLLFIDVEPDTRRFVDVLLSRDYDLALADTGVDGLDMARSFKPDLILLDLMLPEMDGFAVCEKLAADPQTAEIPVVIFTALDRQHERERGEAVGAVDYITKPFFPRELRQRIEQLLRQHGLNKKHWHKD